MNQKKTRELREEFKQLKSANARLIDKQMEIAVKISRNIHEQGMTEQTLAQKADIDESQLADMLRGEANPTLKTLVKIENVFDKR